MSAPRPTSRDRSWQLAAVVALAVNLYALYAPRVDGPSVPGVRLDWVGHALTFAVLTFTALMARVPPRLVLGLVAANAVVSEAVQHWFLPRRTGDVTDVAADLVGLALGWLAWRLVRRRGLRRDAARGRPDRDR
ncbi:MAG: hypothetical protein BGO96_03525 [Micrococcales bacterium 73-15]|uniref:VanZ family protein n=1 Tax=Salana multivorans TaxID=120377 RepID=UPI00095B0B2E|nr:VanZ family protein [Salana multivorans]OJX98273.1 MAG: hypothetical protein BGO96_03525 [Micrococcales bacterium 73-15]